MQESPLHEMLYLIPHNPSVSRSLRLFRMLSAMFEDDELTSSHSENARLFLEASSWTPLDHLLFILKLYQPSRLIDTVSVTEAREAAQVQALRHDSADIKMSGQGVFLLSVQGPKNITSVFHLASLRFLEVALHFPAPRTGPFTHWRQLCIDLLRAGYNPYHITASSTSWGTPLGVSLRRILNTLHKERLGWEGTAVIVKNCLSHWNLMLIDANVNMQEYIAGEISAWKNSRPSVGLLDNQTSENTETSHDAHWIVFRGIVELTRDSGPELKLAAHLNIADTYDHLEAGERQAMTAKTPLASCLHATGLATQHPTEDIRGLRALHVPGAFPDSRLSGEEDVHEKHRVTQPQTTELLEHSTHGTGPLGVSGALGRASPNAWTAMHDVLMDSPEAETYRKLRFGVKGFSEPSRNDFGHGVVCECMSCVESRALVRANIEKAYTSMYSGDEDCQERGGHGSSGGGGSRDGIEIYCPQPRYPGQG